MIFLPDVGNGWETGDGRDGSLPIIVGELRMCDPRAQTQREHSASCLHLIETEFIETAGNGDPS